MSQATVSLPPTHGRARQAFVVALTAYDASKVNFWVALRNGAGISLALALGIALHSGSSGVIAAVGALNVAAADDVDPYRNRFRRMFTSSLIVALAVLLGTLVAGNSLGAFLVAILGAFLTGLSVSLGAAVADIAVMTFVVIVIFSVQPMTLPNAALSALAAFLGGMLQAALSVALWPIRRLQPDRSLIADLFAELARAATTPPGPDSAPLASHQSNYVRESLTADPNAESIEARRHLLLINQAERLRLSLVALRILRERSDGELAHAIDQFLVVCSSALSAIGQAVRQLQGSSPGAQSNATAQLIHTVRRASETASSAATHARATQAVHRIETLTRQLTGTLQFVAGATITPEAALSAAAATVQKLHTPWRLQVNGWLATMRANLSLDSSACRHAIRLTICIAAAHLIGRLYALERSYWIAMTVALVLKPDFGNTFSRGTLRLIGTYAGLILATVLIYILAPISSSHLFAIAIIGIFGFVLRAWGRGNYGILVVAVSALVVFLFSLSGVDARDVITTRAVNTTIGGALALVIYSIWPTRERTQAPPALATMLDSYRLYFQAVSRLYTDRSGLAPHELERARLEGRRLRSNAETSVDRFAAEPNADPIQLRAAQAILISSHRFIHAAMSLEAGEPPALSGPARNTFQAFAWDIEKCLYFLASRLRGSAISPSDLPDPTASRQHLLESEDCHQPSCALLVQETEDLTYSMNLLIDTVFAWPIHS